MNGKRFAVVALSVVAGLSLLLSGCSPAAAPSAATATPAEVVTGFYGWYLDYIGEPGSEEMRNPLVDGAYRSSEYLAAEFVRQVDDLLASFEQGGYDPFLCAQDIPDQLTFDEAAIFGDEATVAVHEVWNAGTPYEAVTSLQVVLRRVDGRWRIADIICSVPEVANPMPEGPEPTTPEGAVSGFYGWYLWYAREVGNPLVDGVYRSSEYLTAGFVRQVDDLLASFEQGGYDPFLCAQDIPESYAFDAATISGDRATVTVHTSFEGHNFVVELGRFDGRWAIDNVACAAAESPVVEVPADWPVFADETAGFQMRFPSDWEYEELPPAPEGEVPDAMRALRRTLVFQPQGWTGMAAPLHIQVTEGTEEEFARMYVTPDSTEELRIDGNSVVKAVEDAGGVQVIHYIFQSPANANVRVVATDYLSGFPERVEGHEDVAEMVQRILRTLTFPH